MGGKGRPFQKGNAVGEATRFRPGCPTRFRPGNAFGQAHRFRPGNTLGRANKGNAFGRANKGRPNAGKFRPRAPVTFTPHKGGRYAVAFPMLWSRAHKAMRSRVVWMMSHKTSLPACLVVHHVNEVKGDDRPANLAAMWPRWHSWWHRQEP